MSVVSIRLAAATLSAGGTTTLYTVPAGRRTIVKSVDCFNLHGGLNRLTFDVMFGGAVQGTWEHMMDSSGTVGEVRHDVVWVVMNAGESLRGSVAFDTVTLIVSGAQLVL